MSLALARSAVDPRGVANMRQRDALSRAERHEDPNAAYLSVLRARRSSDDVQSEPRLTCDEETTPLVTWRGHVVTIEDGPAAAHATRWTIWALGGGTFVRATPLVPSPRPLVPRPAASVDVFAGAPPSVAHVHVALLEATQEAGFDRQGPDYMVQRLREKAGELGCDAVLVKRTSQRIGADGDFWEPNPKTLLANGIIYWGSASSTSASTGGVEEGLREGWRCGPTLGEAPAVMRPVRL